MSDSDGPGSGEKRDVRESSLLELAAALGSRGRWQRLRIEGRQIARDRARNEAFRRGTDITHRGQFAMWIQTPEGQQYEKWSRHAYRVSTDIDDRLDAWELAWELALEREREERQEVLEFYISDNMEPVGRRDRGRDKVRALYMVLTVFVGVVLMVVSAALSPEGISGSPFEWLAFVGLTPMVVGVLGVAYYGIHILGTREHEDKLEAKRREELESEFSGLYAMPMEEADIPSWHASMSGEELRDRSRRISRVAEKAHENFPRRGQLLHLSGTYSTSADLEVDELPQDVAVLLETFRADDVVRRGELKAAGLP